MTKTRPGEHDGYLSFSSFLSGVWSTVSFSTLPLRHSMARLSPTLATTSSMPSLSSATVHVVPALTPAPTETWGGRSQDESKMLWQVWPQGSEEPHRAPHTHTHTHIRATTWILEDGRGEGLEGGIRWEGLVGDYGPTTDEAVTHAASTQTQRHDVRVDVGSLINVFSVLQCCRSAAMWQQQ